MLFTQILSISPLRCKMEKKKKKNENHHLELSRSRESLSNSSHPLFCEAT